RCSTDWNTSRLKPASIGSAYRDRGSPQLPFLQAVNVMPASGVREKPLRSVTSSGAISREHELREGVMSVARVVVLIGLGLFTATSTALAEDPFYKGKRINVLVNFDAGSATDIEGRVFARHVAKHIDGQPQVIVQNIAGAGGNNGTQYLGEVAPKDGTTFGYLTGSAWNFASHPQTFRLDF